VKLCLVAEAEFYCWLCRLAHSRAIHSTLEDHHEDSFVWPTCEVYDGLESASDFVWCISSSDWLSARRLYRFIPRCFAVSTIVDVSGKCYVEMENLTFLCKNPCVMDVKMGARLYNYKATDVKKAKMISKGSTSTSEKLGIRLTGVKAIGHDGKHLTVTRNTGRTATTRLELLQVFTEYIDVAGARRAEVCEAILSRLRELLEWFTEQRFFGFYGSSLIFVYDSHPGSSHETRITLVDFAHVVLESGVHDEGFLFGIHQLVQCFAEIRSNLDRVFF